MLGVDDRVVKANDPELPTDINLSELYAKSLPKAYIYLSKKVKKETKMNFADWLLEQDDDVFECLRSVFEQVEEVLGANQ